MKLTAREKEIKKLCESWQTQFKQEKSKDKDILMFQWIQRQACADAILRILAKP